MMILLISGVNDVGISVVSVHKVRLGSDDTFAGCGCDCREIYVTCAHNSRPTAMIKGVEDVG